jgi:hypothetical protein
MSTDVSEVRAASIISAIDIQLRTRQYIPEDSELHTRRRENLKSHIVRLCCVHRLFYSIIAYVPCIISVYRIKLLTCFLFISLEFVNVFSIESPNVSASSIITGSEGCGFHILALCNRWHVKGGGLYGKNNTIILFLIEIFSF